MRHARTPTELTLTEEFFLVALDDATGRPMIGRDALGAGLAGAAIATLLLAGRAAVHDAMLVATDGDPVDDPICDPLLAGLRRERRQPVGAWIALMRDGLPAIVAEDLEALGVLRTVRVRQVVTRRTVARFPADDPVRAVGPRVRLGYALGRPVAVDDRTAVLAQIVRATGMDRWFVTMFGPVVRNRLAALAQRMDPQLGVVVTAISEPAPQARPTIRLWPQRDTSVAW
ncbi:GPP34 family phosphoprotein [Solwaraspora sp. WMMD406]|uniref:GOLPH3/VPS74 family protein n=1 Tax=Solwaraspora sp. WMMD406 TaxID=3016095 RepID=UPI002417D2C3|nr:GPP34 family phosphoprotein [Solwaraspora sp. WMMD406]MDG4766663.1 GPP34 family phosphoprotein [Solwaraspora sp. WMMD406]